MPRKTAMALTPELVARSWRSVAPVGLPSDLVAHTDEDFARFTDEVLAAHSPGDDIWVFAYGSLLWKPGFEHIEERRAVAHGWHRAFRIWLRTHRGTPDFRGLMMGLDRGGRCAGVAMRLDGSSVREQLEQLIRREMPVRPLAGRATNVPRWIRVDTDVGQLSALAFVLNPAGPNYSGRLELEHTADVLARACGTGGSCAEYLHNTVVHLEERGIRDRNLWRLQALVAECLAAMEPPQAG